MKVATDNHPSHHYASLGRVICVYPEFIFRMESRIMDFLGSSGSVVLIQEGEAYMAGIIERLTTRDGQMGREDFLKLLTEEMEATGWGKYQFNLEKQNQKMVVLEGTDLPYERGPTRHWFLVGMLIQIVESAFAAKLNLKKSEWLDDDRIRVELELSEEFSFGPIEGPRD